MAAGVTKRCRLSWLTNNALVYEPKCWVGGGGVAGSQPMSTAVQMEPKKTSEYLTPYYTYEVQTSQNKMF
jgi:hypothetical protein